MGTLYLSTPSHNPPSSHYTTSGDKAEFLGKDDEGFDEGFCEDGEMPQDDRDSEPRVPAMIPLDLQDILNSAIPATALAQPQPPTSTQDDFEFDLGVDMLDAEHIQHNMADKTPLVPSLQRSPPLCFGVFTSELSSPSSSNTHPSCGHPFEDTRLVEHVAVKPDMDTNTETCSLDMCLTDCCLATTSCDMVVWNTTGVPLSSPLPPLTTPVLTTLSELVAFPPPTLPPTPPLTLPAGEASDGTLSPASSHSILPLSPSTPSSIVAVGASGVTKGNIAPEIIKMPFYQFKKILECPNLPEQKKAEVKNIRRRGKNKMAAKNCRQRKLEVIMGLQEEVDRLKDTTSKMRIKNLALEKQIEMFKLKCFQLTSSTGGINQKQLLTS